MALCTLCPAQSGARKSPLCTRDNALEMIKAQVDVAKSLSEAYRRIPVLIRAADLLWPHQQERARTIFTDAFDLATEHEKEVDEKGPRTLVLRMQYPDQRHVVIRAIAKRDARWAKEITRQMLSVADASPSRDSFSDLLMAERLLDSASKLISTDINAAVDLARASFRYPASAGLTRFLYALAQVNQRAADDLYYLALGTYATKPMREFLYLQAYPFLLPASLNTPFFAYYQVPLNYVTTDITLNLRRGFVNLIVQRAQRALEEPLRDGDAYRDQSGIVTPPSVHLLRSLMELEPHIKGPLLELLPAVTQARERILVSLSPERQRLLLQPGREISTAPVRSFDEEIESALKTPDVNVRDDLLATAILSDQSNSQRLEKLIELVDKISYSDVRAPLLDTLYFRRVMSSIRVREYENGGRLASKVEGHEQRAYLRIQIAKAYLQSETQIYATEFLDQAIADARKAGSTIFAARTLLTASNLYAEIDLGKAISILTEAINVVNRLESPDFVRDDQSLVRRVPRPGIGRGHYMFHDYMPGLHPERALGEMAKRDFDTALSQTSALTDKLQRSLSILALADVCLQQTSRR